MTSVILRTLNAYPEWKTDEKIKTSKILLKKPIPNLVFYKMTMVRNLPIKRCWIIYKVKTLKMY